MLKTERKQLILEELNQHQVVSLEKLVSLLETSESTVRRDLDELEAENKLRRVHGGAELPHSLQEEETIQEKSVKNLQEKKLLAQKAASLIKEQDVSYYLNRYQYTNQQARIVVDAVWSNMYNNISNVNNVLRHINDISAGTQERKMIHGEALGLRGFMHFDLARLH